MMKTKTLRTLSLAVVLVTLLGAPGLIMAADPVVKVNPAAGTISVDQTVAVTITVEDVTSLFGAEFHLTFDPSLVEVVDADAATDGTQIGIGDFLAADFVAQNAADNTTGKIDFGMSQMAPHGAVSGSGTLATITFKGKGAGTSSIAFTNILLADSGGGQISASAQNGTITVSGSATAEPTTEPTAEPTTETPTETPTTVPTTVVPAPSGCSFQGYHTVKPGETLYSIGRAYGTKPASIASCNSILNPSCLYVGTKLGIPVAPWSPIPAGPVAVAQFTPGSAPAPTPVPTTGCRFYHTVAYGETLTAIAIRYGANVWSIGQANSILNLNLIFPQQTLCIP